MNKEDQLQIAVARYLDFHKVLWFHVANERQTSRMRGAKLKKMGVKSGVSDIIILEPMGRFNGLCLELKIKPNKPTAKQQEFLDKAERRGYFTAVAYDFDQARNIIDSYFRL